VELNTKDGNSPEIDEESSSVLPQIDTDDLIQDIDNLSDITLHSNRSDPIPGIPVKQTTLNTFRNQIHFVLSDTTNLEPKITHPHSSKTRMTFHISPLIPTQDVIRIIKEYIRLGVHYGIYFSSSDRGDLYDTQHLYIKFSQTLQEHFKDTLNFDLVRVTEFTQDIENKDEQFNIINKYHNGITNHRGINGRCY